LPQTVRLTWHGPYWFMFFHGIAPRSILGRSGVYVIAVRRNDKCFVYNPGSAKVCFGGRLGQKLGECLGGRWYLHDPEQTLREGKLGAVIYDPKRDAGRLGDAALRWASLLYVFMAPMDDAGEIIDVEMHLHLFMKRSHGRQSDFALMYDMHQGSRRPKRALRLCSQFVAAPIEGLDSALLARV
jgi:hypothetical protein